MTQVSARDKKFFQGGESTCPNRTEHTLMTISFKKRVSDIFIKSRKELEGKVPKVIKDPNVFFSIHDQNIIFCCVPDPDPSPPDPHVFGPPGS